MQSTPQPVETQEGFDQYQCPLISSFWSYSSVGNKLNPDAIFVVEDWSFYGSGADGHVGGYMYTPSRRSNNEALECLNHLTVTTFRQMATDGKFHFLRQV